MTEPEPILDEVTASTATTDGHKEDPPQENATAQDEDKYEDVADMGVDLNTNDDDHIDDDDDIDVDVNDSRSGTGHSQRSATTASQIDDPDQDTLRIMLSTDNHLGYQEENSVRGNDSFAALEEVLYLAKHYSCDLVLLAGDLFHENRPSRRTLFKTSKYLLVCICNREYIGKYV